MLCRSIALEHTVTQITFITGIVSHSSTANRKSMQAGCINLLALYLITLVVTIKGADCRMLITCGCIVCVLVWGSWVITALMLRVQIFWEESLCRWLSSSGHLEGLWCHHLEGSSSLCCYIPLKC
jgi:4-amino-4-deoxy-L-arabinose transferase-like glycosyltransferase